jgi:hypothetical protein
VKVRLCPVRQLDSNKNVTETETETEGVPATAAIMAAEAGNGHDDIDTSTLHLEGHISSIVLSDCNLTGYVNSLAGQLPDDNDDDGGDDDGGSGVGGSGVGEAEAEAEAGGSREASGGVIGLDDLPRLVRLDMSKNPGTLLSYCNGRHCYWCYYCRCVGKNYDPPPP